MGQPWFIGVGHLNGSVADVVAAHLNDASVAAGVYPNEGVKQSGVVGNVSVGNVIVGNVIEDPIHCRCIELWNGPRVR